MPVRARTAVEQALLLKGMEQDDSHHHMFRKTVAGVTHLVTRTSHNMAEIDDTLAKRMANQLCLQLREFWRLIECPLSEEDWEGLIRQRCAGGQNPFLRRGG